MASAEDFNLIEFQKNLVQKNHVKSICLKKDGPKALNAQRADIVSIIILVLEDFMNVKNVHIKPQLQLEL